MSLTLIFIQSSTKGFFTFSLQFFTGFLCFLYEFFTGFSPDLYGFFVDSLQVYLTIKGFLIPGKGFTQKQLIVRFYRVCRFLLQCSGDVR